MNFTIPGRQFTKQPLLVPYTARFNTYRPELAINTLDMAVCTNLHSFADCAICNATMAFACNYMVVSTCTVYDPGRVLCCKLQLESVVCCQNATMPRNHHQGVGISPGHSLAVPSHCAMTMCTAVRYSQNLLSFLGRQ